MRWPSSSTNDRGDVSVEGDKVLVGLAASLAAAASISGEIMLLVTTRWSLKRATKRNLRV